MIRKSVVLAAVAAVGVALSAGAAEAKTRVHIGAGFGYGYPGWGYGGWCSPMDPFCGTGLYYPRHRYGYGFRRDRFDPVWDPYRLTCKEAAWKLGQWGYYNVRQVSCGGNFHTLKATKKGKRYTFRANANTGRIVRTR
jgi:hypothetical protein